eukprot:165789-Chlamydomonas_euryale.AAC.1
MGHACVCVSGGGNHACAKRRARMCGEGRVGGWGGTCGRVGKDVWAGEEGHVGVVGVRPSYVEDRVP